MLTSWNTPSTRPGEEEYFIGIARTDLCWKEPPPSTLTSNLEILLHYKICAYNLKTHMLTHGTNRAFHCQHCTSSFKLKHHLCSHIETVHEGKKPFECTFADCSYASSNKFNVQKHLRNIHRQFPPFHIKKAIFNK